ncbi:hypothetical protein GCM10028805_11610 [Spirosoma harenae]
MEIDFSTLPFVISLAIGFLIVYTLLYYRFVYSIIDPLFIWVVTTAFSSVLATQVIPDTQSILHFFGCQIAVWTGFLVAYRRANSLEKKLTESERIYNFTGQSLLRWATYFLLVIYIISNIIIGYKKGFAILSDAPTQSKIENFTEGFGLFRKINWSAGTFVSTSLVYMYLIKRRKQDLLFLLLVAFFYSLDGSKAALLQIAVSAGIVFYHPLFSEEQQLLEKVKRYIPIFILIAMSTVTIVLMKENDGLDAAFFAFIRRLLYSADSLLYYFQPVNIAYFEKYSAWDYITVITNPILGFLRLQPYKEAPGVLMIDNLRLPGSFASAAFAAPNAPFYIEARIYFNFWVGFPFSFLVGYIYSVIRTYYFSLRQSSAFYFIFIGSFCHLASAMLGDVNLAVTQSFDLLFFVTPAYILVSFLLVRKIYIRLNIKLIKLLKTAKILPDGLR